VGHCDAGNLYECSLAGAVLLRVQRFGRRQHAFDPPFDCLALNPEPGITAFQEPTTELLTKGGLRGGVAIVLVLDPCLRALALGYATSTRLTGIESSGPPI